MQAVPDGATSTGITDGLNAVIARINEFFTSLLGSVELWQLLLSILLLIALVIILIAAFSARGRKIDELAEEKEKLSYATMRTEKESRLQISEKEDALIQARRDNERAIASLKDEHEAAAQDMSETIQTLSARVDELSAFQKEYIAIPNARVEAQRIIRDAREHAYVVSNRTEMEYAEIIEHANREADSIRAQAQQRLTRSHDALKQALARANEIIEDAHAEANRIARIAYVPGPGLIEAPADAEDAAPVEPAAEPATEPAAEAPVEPAAEPVLDSVAFITNAPVAPEQAPTGEAGGA